MVESKLHQSEPLSLRFESHNDALDYASQLVEDSNRFLTANKLDIANRYKKGELEIHLRCRANRLPIEFHLVFLSIPADIPSQDESAWQFRASPNSVTRIIQNNRTDKRVFIGITEFVKCPEEIISSFVCLEPAHKIGDFWMQVLAFPLHAVLKINSIGSEGKISEPSSLAETESVNSLVESETEVVGGIGGDIEQELWQRLCELEFNNFLSIIRVNLTDYGVRVCAKEIESLPFKVLDVMLCPRNATL
jgi:hypothetical protein